MVGPQQIARMAPMSQEVEGCLSFPGFGAPVIRPIWVEVVCPMKSPIFTVNYMLDTYIILTIIRTFYISIHIYMIWYVKIWFSHVNHISGWWFGTWLLFSISFMAWDNPSHWLIFFRGVETTNQLYNVVKTMPKTNHPPVITINRWYI